MVEFDLEGFVELVDVPGVVFTGVLEGKVSNCTF